MRSSTFAAPIPASVVFDAFRDEVWQALRWKGADLRAVRCRHGRDLQHDETELAEMLALLQSGEPTWWGRRYCETGQHAGLADGAAIGPVPNEPQ